MTPLFSRAQIPMLAMFGAAVLLPWLVSGYYVQFAAKVLILGTLAMALNLSVGFGGMVSLCHAAFFGLAGYTLILVTPEYEVPSLLLTLVAAIAVVAVSALVIGLLSLRTRGIYFIMVTLAFGEMLFFLFHDTSIGGGSDGIFLYVKPVLAAGSIVLLDLESPIVFYLVALSTCVACWCLITHLLATPFGDALTAARDNERRALSLGIPVFRVRLVAFVVSAVMAGIAGYLSAAQFGFVAPQMLGWHSSATALVMVVLGGTRRVAGPLFGAILLVGLEDLLKIYVEEWKLYYGLIIIMLVLFFPGGLQDLLRLSGTEAFFRRKLPQPVAVGGKL
ncbi:branched-chain amino acid ABC transporter permease [Agrobacterium rhizogenes]|nr:branched-chain amino acid ABC transporter permease [Rhizobium rhizogenes]NTG04765.1 branched-chain amino acid ABC transporter permease [Rhizobium rhizogenes]NTG18364.1 branched-chain amino acid ABC transporter permease [Rhizobium rhizogenes]NTG32095.1 branched-chain amino acid ABC transporter permease [Rhizobium rhizogenes]NTH10056.1 branched-chain amino acid ABC transporter permease [Rhizobium rhizogenes]